MDDSPIARETMALFLDCHAGYELAGFAHDGQEGVELAAALHPDLVLMDMRMPVMNGLDATRQIKLQAEPPVVVMVSVDDGMAYRAASVEVGADGFVSKLQMSTQLAPLVEHLFKRTPEQELTLQESAVPSRGYAHALNRLIAPTCGAGIVEQGPR